MTDFNAHSEPNATPEDVATLYSWANLHGAKYRDFSAARAQTRETARLRAEQALAEAKGRTLDAEAGPDAGAASNLELEAEESRIAVDFDHQQSGFAHGEVLPPQGEALAAEAEAAREAELAEQTARQKRWAEEQEAKAREAAAQEAAAQQAAAQAQAAHEAELARQQVEQARVAQAAREREAQELAAQQAAEQARHEQLRQDQLKQEQIRQEQATQQAAEQARQAAEMAQQQAADQAKQQAAEQAERELHSRPWPRPDRFPKAPFSTPAYSSYQPQESGVETSPNQPSYHRPSEGLYDPARELNPASSQAAWNASEAQETAGGPAWLTTDRPEARAEARPEAGSQLPARLAGQPAASLSAPEDTLQGSRDRLTSRWFALRGIFDGTQPAEAAPAPTVSKAPAMAVFSLAGGVGKTSLVATLGRALSSRGERVLLVDTAAFGLLPFFFGATDQRPGVLRTFNPPGLSNDAPIQMVTIDPDGLGPEPSGQSSGQESLSGEISKYARGAGRVIVDLATASGSTTRRILRMSPLVLVPVIPDMNSVVSVSSIDAFFEHNSNPAGKPSLPFYVLNQFDASLPLHLDVREVLREQLGDRLLPFALRRMPAISEALAEGMTVVDYAPNSPLADDFSTLAGWVKSLSAPATTTYRGVRWSER
jgi:cellulose synthase operon protein YhjQ